MINKRKKWIMEGLDPDEEEQKILKKRKRKNKEKKIKTKQLEKSDEVLVEDIVVNTEINNKNDF